MIATVEKRPLGGLDEYVHFIVLGLCSMNIIFKIYNFSQSEPLDILSLAISLIGVAAFFMIHKGEKWGELLLILWTIPQLVSWNQTTLSSTYSLDLSQGFSLPINIGAQGGVETFSLGVNMIAVGFLFVALFRIRHRIYQSTIYLTSIDLKNPIQLTAQVDKIYKIGEKQRVLVFNNLHNGSHYALIASKSDKLKFDNFGQVYSICKVNSNIVEQSQLKASDFKKVFSAKAST